MTVKDEQKQTSMYLDKEDLKQLKIIAARHEISVNNLIRQAIKKIIEEEEKGEIAYGN